MQDSQDKEHKKDTRREKSLAGYQQLITDSLEEISQKPFSEERENSTKQRLAKEFPSLMLFMAAIFCLSSIFLFLMTINGESQPTISPGQALEEIEVDITQLKNGSASSKTLALSIGRLVSVYTEKCHQDLCSQETFQSFIRNIENNTAGEENKKIIQLLGFPFDN